MRPFLSLRAVPELSGLDADEPGIRADAISRSRNLGLLFLLLFLAAPSIANAATCSARSVVSGKQCSVTCTENGSYAYCQAAGDTAPTCECRQRRN